MARLRSWDGLLLLLVVVVISSNLALVPGYGGTQNRSTSGSGIEKAIVVLAMTFVIINGEIDLSVASMMGLATAVVARLWEGGRPSRSPSWPRSRPGWGSGSSRASGWRSWAFPHWS